MFYHQRLYILVICLLEKENEERGIVTERLKRHPKRVVFPEGTRSRDGSVRQFHPGGVRMILSRTNVPVTAVAVDGGYRFVSVADTIKGLSSIVYRARLVGVFHHDGTKQGIMDAVQDAQQAISDQVDRWRAGETASRGEL